MAEEITQEIFDHLVDLAALELSTEEAVYLRRELNGQLEAIRELEAIELADGISLTSHGVPYTAEISPPIRTDEVIRFPDLDALLEQVPQLEERYIVVPDIPQTELS